MSTLPTVRECVHCKAPLWTPDDLVSGHQGVVAGVPVEAGIVTELLDGRALAGRGRPDQLADGHVLGHRRRVGGAPHAGPD